MTKDTKAAPNLTSIDESVHEPPLKRFKALFESTNPESMNLESIPMDDQVDTTVSGPSQTQPDVESRSLRNMSGSSLAILREEEEETQNVATETSLQRGRKRRLSSEDDVEVQIMDEDRNGTTSDVAEPSNKRRAVENVNAISPVNPNSEETTTMTRGSEPPSKVGPTKAATTIGAPPGKPDTDDAFLKAIASTKRGKKNEDDFDREFNKLKLTKPELDRHDPEEEWGVLANFGDDSGLRGNFMVIVEIDPYQRESNSAGITRLKEKSINCEWGQRLNFKKFKKVSWVWYDFFHFTEARFRGRLELHEPRSNFLLIKRILTMEWQTVGR